jgi:hypothetical protein
MKRKLPLLPVDMVNAAAESNTSAASSNSREAGIQIPEVYQQQNYRQQTC